MEQETLEELAKEFYSDENQLMERIAFKRGYTECKENMYSEEEVEKMVRAAYTFGEKDFKYFGVFKEWFEQFKKNNKNTCQIEKFD